jgi:integrase
VKTPKYRRNGDGRAFSVFPGSGGKRQYFGAYGTPEAEAAYKRWLASLLKADVAPQPVPLPTYSPTMPLAVCVDAYLEWAKSYYGRQEYLNLYSPLLALTLHSGDLPARSFGPNALRAFRDFLAEKGYEKGGRHHAYTRTSLNVAVNKVRRMVRWCESRELLPAGSAATLATLEALREGKCDAPDAPPVGSVPWDVVEATLPFMRNVHKGVERNDLAAMVQVQYWCGMRPGEVCRMTSGQIDRSGAVWWYRPVKHKTAHHGKALVKAVPKPAQEILQPFIDKAPSPDAPLFTTRWGNAYVADSYCSAVGCAIKVANRAGVAVPHWSPNQLRHAVAERVDALLGREAAQHYLGHSRPDTTAIYAGRNSDMLRRAAEALAEAAPARR